MCLRGRGATDGAGNRAAGRKGARERSRGSRAHARAASRRRDARVLRPRVRCRQLVRVARLAGHREHACRSTHGGDRCPDRLHDSVRYAPTGRRIACRPRRSPAHAAHHRARPVRRHAAVRCGPEPGRAGGRAHRDRVLRRRHHLGIPSIRQRRCGGAQPRRGGGHPHGRDVHGAGALGGPRRHPDRCGGVACRVHHVRHPRRHRMAAAVHPARAEAPAGESRCAGHPAA